MRSLEPTKTAAVLGVALGSWHGAWALLVLAGWAEPILGWILQLHFLELPVEVAPFNASTAIALVVLTTVIGFIGGFLVALAWNWFTPEAKVPSVRPAIR